MTRGRLGLGLLVGLLVAVPFQGAPAVAAMQAGVLPSGFTDTLVASVAGPTAMAFTSDGRMLITTQAGQLYLYRNGVLVTPAALDLRDRVCADRERGLLGAAIDPLFVSNRFIYLFYTYKKFGSCPYFSTNSPVNRVSRFVLADNGIVDATSEVVLIDGMLSSTGIHNGGDLQFGNDGYLYVSVGEGHCDYAQPTACSSANDAGRDPFVLLGKILRIKRDGTIPADNPYTGPNTARCNVDGRTDPQLVCQETYATGLRNPWRIAFDPNAATTRFFINDVGQNAWEEIDLGGAGADYGWNIREGPCVADSTTDCGPPPAGMTNPLYSYPHTSGCAAITGGAFVPNGIWPAEFDSAYLYGDYVCGKIFALRSTDSGLVASDFVTGLGVSSATSLAFGPSPGGVALYYASFAGGGEIRRIEYTGSANRSPTAAATASPAAGAVPLEVRFDASASTDPDGDPLTYVWDYGDGTPLVEVGSAVVTHTYGTAGTFYATLLVRDAGAVSQQVTLRIDPGNNAPQPTIVLPANDDRFRVGETIVLRGSANDAEEGALSSDRLSWTVVLRHNEHTHPFLQPTVGNDVPINAPAPEDLAATSSSWLKISLTATDSQGVSATTTQILLPRTVNVTLDSDPTGIALVVNGQSMPTPKTLISWDGYALNVTAPTVAPQNLMFAQWSDGATEASRVITTPPSDASYAALYRQAAETTVSVPIVVGGDDGDVSANSMRGSGLYPPDRPPTVSSASTSVGVRRSGPLFGGYEVRAGLLRFDTASLPDDATITGAKLRLYVSDRTSANGRDVVAEWYAATNWPIDAGDYTANPASTAHTGTSIASLLLNAQNDLALQNLAAISTIASTGIRLHINGGQPSGENKVFFSALEHTSQPEPQLIVTYTSSPPPPPAETTVSVPIVVGGDDGDVSANSMRGSGLYPPDRPPTVSSASTSVGVRRSGPLFGGYEVRAGLLRFDTASLPDDATITGAKLRLYVSDRTSANGRDVVAEWYAATNWPIDAGDYTANPASTAHTGTSIASLLLNAQNDLALQNLAAISTIASTGIRLHINGGQPSGENKVFFSALEHTSQPQAELIITYRTSS